MKELIGVSLVALPFVVITLLMVKSIGLKDAVIVWLATLAIVACMVVGLWIATGGKTP